MNKIIFLILNPSRPLITGMLSIHPSQFSRGLDLLSLAAGDASALKLETEVAEDYAKFYNHGEGLLLVESI